MRHMLAVEVMIEPLVEVRDVSLTWYVGLDADATKIGDQLWNGMELDPQTTERIVALYRLRIADVAIDEPIYLILAMTPERTLRVKPQNLLAGLPARRPEVVS